MERIAIISDIHGNIPAFEAVLRDMERRKADRVYCLGDLVGKGPDSGAAVDLARRHCDRIVMGNWDDFITKSTEDPTIRWHQSRLGEERMAYLRTLPFAIELRMSGRRVRLFHASPRSFYERIQPWDAYERRLSLFEGSEQCGGAETADVAGYGDIHNAYLQHLEGKMLFNAGSVGNPLDIPQASYVIAEGEADREDAAPFQLQFVRVPYDIGLSIRQAEEAGMPALEPYRRELLTAQYRGRQN